MKLRHIAVFTEDMKKSVEFYQTLGGKAYAEALLDIGGGKTKKLVHMVFEGEGTVELVEPGSREMMPAGAGICEHFCFAVKDVDEEFSRLKSFGIDTFDSDAPYELNIFGGVKIIFLTGPNGETIELLQYLNKAK